MKPCFHVLRPFLLPPALALLLGVLAGTARAGEVTGQVLGPKEVADPAFRVLAQKFAPCLVFAGPDMWPTAAAYQWSQGSPLMRGVEGPGGKLQQVEEVLSASVLSKRPWADLPQADPQGRHYVYYVDGPGENTGPGEEDATWITEWRRIQGGGPPAKAPYPPTVLTQGLWLPTQAGENKKLVIKYWFFYPYNKWMNNHESDWENMNVALEQTKPGKGALGGDWRLLELEYFFHGDGVMLKPQEVFVAGPLRQKEGQHPVVFAGGRARSGVIKWTGTYSGGSYPWPAKFSFGIVQDDTTQPKRFLHAEDITLDYLTDPAKMDYQKRPDLSWFNLDTRLGQPQVMANDPVVIQQGGHEFIGHAGRKGKWAKHGSDFRWVMRPRVLPADIPWPRDWKLLNQPTHQVMKHGSGQTPP